MPPRNKGKVYLIGAGPGDPGLLTLRGKECIEKADVVIYDHLANEDLLTFASPGTETIFVGKIGGKRMFPQERINALLVEHAKRGKIVARLKGGDPFIFGRGGEEAEELSKAGVSFEIVPGVTSAVAAPAYAGIPLTHRNYTSTVFFAAGSEDSGKEGGMVDWGKVSTGAGTLVFFMGVRTLARNVAKLIECGRDPHTPAALIRWGTTPEQKTIVGTLKTIVSLAEKEEMKPPGIFIVGDVVGLRDRLRWVENKPLHGKRILITRTREQAGPISEFLKDLGADVVGVPTIEIVPPKSWKKTDAALKKLSGYHWAIFTSANAVRFFFDRLGARKKDVRGLAGMRICAIGSRTAESLEDRGLRPDVVPGEAVAEAVVKAMGRLRLKGKRILFPRAQEAREVIPEELRRRGAQVNVVDVYRTVIPWEGTVRILRLLRGKRIHAVTFTSSSTVRNFLEMIGKDNAHLVTNGIALAAIGPVTAETMRSCGLTPHVVGSSLETMVSGLAAYLQAHTPST